MDTTFVQVIVFSKDSLLSYFESQKDPLSLGRNVLHYAASCAQLLCLGLRSFVQGHLGMPDFSFMDRKVNQIYLDGCNLSLHRIRAYSQRLTYFGQVLQGPVIVFERCEAVNFPASERDPCDLVCSLENIAYIWGNTKVGYARSTIIGDESHINRLWIRGGVLHPSDLDGKLWHWASEEDTKRLSQILDDVERVPAIFCPQFRDKIRIGAVIANEECPLSGQNGQEAMQGVVGDHLVLLDTYPGFWKSKTRCFGIHVKQWVELGATEWQERDYGITLKEDLLNGDEHHILNRFSKLWGVRLSLCTVQA
jgi:hypothetical protein